MNYKKVVAYIPDTSVLFELDNGLFALVSEEQITVSKYAESHLKFGGFVEGKSIPENELKKAEKLLREEKNVFMSRDTKAKK